MKRNDARTQAGRKPGRDRSDSRVPIACKANPRVPEGEYEAVCYNVQTGRSWGGREDIYIRFRLIGGPHDSEELFMACTFHTKGELTSRHKYYKQWTMAAGRTPERHERLVFGVFKNRLFRILVRDVEKDSSGQPLPDVLRYSVVATIIEPMTGKWSDE